MYSTLLFLHFVGIALGAGTGIFIMALSRYAKQHLEPAETKTLMPGILATVSKVGSAGLLLLLLSGISMAYLLGSAVLTELFLVKMLLVTAIVIYVVMVKSMAAQSKANPASAPKNQRIMHNIGPLGPSLAALTILVAVMLFH